MEDIYNGILFIWLYLQSYFHVKAVIFEKVVLHSYALFPRLLNDSVKNDSVKYKE